MLIRKHMPNKPDDGVVAANEEEVGQENLKKLALDTNEKCANDVAMETCTTTRDTASIDGRVKKDPVEDVGQEGLSEPLPRDPENSAKDKLARERLDSSSEMGSKLLDEFASNCEKKFPEEPPEEENKTEGTRTDVLVLVLVLVLFLLLYNGAVMVRDFMEMKQQQRVCREIIDNFPGLQCSVLSGP